MEFSPDVLHTLIGAGGAAGLALALILVRILVPWYYHERVVEQNRKLQAAYDALVKANAELREQNIRLADNGQFTNQLVGALVNLAEQRHAGPYAIGDGGPPATKGT